MASGTGVAPHCAWAAVGEARATMMFISNDCRSIVFNEVSDKAPYHTDLVVRDTTLHETFRMTIRTGGVPGMAWSRETRLLVVSDGTKLRAFVIP